MPSTTHKATRKCVICGAEYPYCKSWSANDIFRWQDVACCREHASIYLERMKEKNAAEEKTVEKDAPVKADTDDNSAENVEQKPATPKKRTRKPKKRVEGEADK